MSSSSSSVTQPKTCNDIIVAMEKATESQVVSSVSSSQPQPEKCNDVTVAVEESKEMATETQPEKSNDITVAVEESMEEATENNNPGQGCPQEVISERRSENPSLVSGAVPTGNEIMQRYPPRSNKIFTCPICKTGFLTSQALGGHQNAHKKEREWEKKRKDMEQKFPGYAFLNPHIDKPHLFFLGGYSKDALSNDNHLGIPTESFKRRLTGVYPYFNSDMNITVVPRMPPTRFFTGNTFTNGSSSGGLGPRPPYNNYHSMIPRNVPPFPPLRTTNRPSGLYPQENVLNEEDVVLKLGNDNIVAAGQPEEGTSKSWGADLSL